jgi:hypothetical protein
MTTDTRAARSRRDRGRRLCPSLQRLEERVNPSLYFPGIAGITFDSSGDLFVSYDSSSGTRSQSVAEISPGGFELSSGVFGTSGSSAFPGALATVGAATSYPSPRSVGEILELQPDGELFLFDPQTGASSLYDNLANHSATASHVFDAQTGAYADLSGRISLSGAVYGDFGAYGNSLVFSAKSNGLDLVARVNYGPSGGVATVLAASSTGDGSTAAPGGVAVDSQGTVLATLPYLPAGASSPMHVPVGFSLSYDTGSTPAPFLPTLGLTAVPNIDAAAITVDAQDNFILAVTDTSLYGGGPGVAHINSALTAFLADPVSATMPAGISYQNVGGNDYLAFTDAGSGTYTIGHEIPLFSGQVTPAQLRHAYGIDQVRFTGPGGTTVTGDGSGQTIAIVEEGVDPTIGADLTTFDQFFGIPAPPSFQVVDQNGVTTQNLDIVGEASLDVEWAHAMAPGASIVVYNAAYDPNDPTGSFVNLITSMKQASQLPGVSVVTLSYGMPESDLGSAGLDQQALDANFTTPGVTFLAASGDTGIYGNGGYPPQVSADYPAASANILSVGGTSITIDAAGDYPGTGPSGEVAWGSGRNSWSTGGGGGGLSSYESEPSWQASVVPASIDPYGARAVPDVAMDSGSAQEYDVFTSTLGASAVSASAVGWLGDAGTSAASPIWAGLLAIADQGRALAGGTPLSGNTQTLPALYSLPAADFHDIVQGNNGDAAGPGFDLTSGLGTPVANLLVPALAAYGMPGHATVSAEPPASVLVGGTFGLTVAVMDGAGNPASGGTVTVGLGNNPGSAVLGGTLTEPVVGGLARFSDLTLSQVGSGYTLTVTASGIPGTQTTTPITVTTGNIATQVVASALPAPPTVGQAITLSATVSVVSPASGLPSGTVTFEEGTQVLGTATLTGGVAQLSTRLTAAGAQTITVLYSGDANDQPSSTTLSLSVGKGGATLALGNLSTTYAGSPLAASVTTSPAGLTGVSIRYAQNGIAVAAPLHAGSYQVTATLDNPNYAAQAVTGTLVVGQATPIITWPIPANITFGTPLGATQLDATATFAGAAVPGSFNYSPATGTVLPVGNGQTLGVSFTPNDAVDFKAVTAAVPINIVSPPPPRVLILGEQPVFKRALKKGKPVGKAVLAGFTLRFNLPLDAAATRPGNYQLDAVKTTRIKNKLVRVLRPITNFTVTYSPAADSVMLNLAGSATFPSGGQLTILPGVTGATGGVLTGTTVFAIAPGGKSISP